MPKRKHKNEPERFVELDPEDLGFVLEPTQIEVGSGYTVSVGYDEDYKPIVDVKTYGRVDTARLRRDIERIFPNAEIRRLGESQSMIVKKRERTRERQR